MWTMSILFHVLLGKGPPASHNDQRYLKRSQPMCLLWPSACTTTVRAWRWLDLQMWGRCFVSRDPRPFYWVPLSCKCRRTLGCLSLRLWDKSQNDRVQQDSADVGEGCHVVILLLQHFGKVVGSLHSGQSVLPTPSVVNIAWKLTHYTSGELLLPFRGWGM